MLVEDDALTNPVELARDLTSLLQLPDAVDIQALVIGRFQKGSGVSRAVLQEILSRQPALAGIPVLANVDVGHTNPFATLPIGGQVEVRTGDEPGLRILR